MIRVGKPQEHVALITETLGVSAIFGQQAKTHEELEVRKDIEAAVGDIPCEWVYNDVLFDPEHLPMPATSFPRSFTGFRKKVEARCTVPPPLEFTCKIMTPNLDPGPMPTLASLGLASAPFPDRSPIAKLQGGETGAWRQVEQYIWSGDYLPTYKETRNGMLDWGHSSKLSPYLALGLTLEAESAAAVLGHNFAGSDWYESSYRLLRETTLEPRLSQQSWLSRLF